MIKFLIVITITISYALSTGEPRGRGYIGVLPSLDPGTRLENEFAFVRSYLSRDVVEDITNRPVFSEGRKGTAPEALSDSTILIDGVYTSVELVGMLGVDEQSVVAILIGGSDMIWLRKNETLGDWQVDEITWREVKLSDRENTVVLKQRAGTSGNVSLDTYDEK